MRQSDIAPTEITAGYDSKFKRRKSQVAEVSLDTGLVRDFVLGFSDRAIHCDPREAHAEFVDANSSSTAANTYPGRSKVEHCFGVADCALSQWWSVFDLRCN